MDRRIRQTATASPAEPGGLPLTLGKNVSLRDIKGDDITDIIKTKRKQHPVAARYLFRVLSPFFMHCVQERYISISPMYGLKPPPPPESRDRVLSADEIKCIWKATSTGAAFDSFHRVLLLTGQRRNEVSGMRWTEIDTKTGTWVIPGDRTKNGREHIVHLSDQVLAILGTTPVIDSDYVFTTPIIKGQIRKEITPVSGYGRAKARLDRSIGFDDWTLHDLRRTFITISNEQKLAAPHVIEAAVNHLTGAAKAGVAGVYNRAAYLDDRRELFNAWGDYVEALVAPKRETQESVPSNVIPLRAVASAH
jgi:integrase